MGVDRVGAVGVEDGLDGDPGVADPVADLGGGGGAELLGPADGWSSLSMRRGAGRAWSSGCRRGCRGPWPCGRRAGLGRRAVLRSAAVAQIRSWRWVRVIVSPMTWSSLVPAYSVGLGWCRVTSQVAWARSSRVACSSGMCLAMAWATVRSRRVTPTVCSRGASTRSTWAAAFMVRVWVFWATRRARQSGMSNVWARRQVCGSRCTRSRASAISVIAVPVGTPRARPRGSGANAATAGVPSPPSDSSASRCAVAAPDGGAGVGGGGVQDAPLVGELELVELGLRGGVPRRP